VNLARAKTSGSRTQPPRLLYLTRADQVLKHLKKIPLVRHHFGPRATPEVVTENPGTSRESFDAADVLAAK